MTTICTDGRTIAADSLSTIGDVVEGTKCRKLHRLPDGSIVGMAGTTKDCLRAIEAIDGEKDSKGEYTLLRLMPNGSVYRYEGCLYPLKAEPPTAIGSGREIALGALLAGASPKEAVKLTSKRCVYTGGRVTEMSV